MPDVLLFGATGYTGRLTAHALARRGASFVVAGRNSAKLEALAADTGGPEVRVAEVGDVEGLAAALSDVRVMITCVGPFTELGGTAVEAALKAGVHYIDSTGEGVFIGRLISDCHERARAGGIAMAPAMGFDEVPADVAATLATEDMDDPELVMTYALPRSPSAGTLVSSLQIMTARGPWIVDGTTKMVRVGDSMRWSPMPPPLGPRAAVAFPLAEGHLAPLHLNLKRLELYITSGTTERIAIKALVPAVRVMLRTPAKDLIEKLARRGPDGPDEKTRAESRWTILAEARSGDRWRNVALSGTDPYGLTAEFLSAAALRMAKPGYSGSGVLSPVQAVGLDEFQKELIDNDVSIETYTA